METGWRGSEAAQLEQNGSAIESERSKFAGALRRPPVVSRQNAFLRGFA
jgi:hypothetical protein